ncbi:hypothetical protein TNCV_2061591 [Trichonephila clavipes]|nr:hypothetical protein TNCV_2061591 [Trichonephila clavipes]
MNLMDRKIIQVGRGLATLLKSNARVIADRPRNFEPRLSDEDEPELASCASAAFTQCRFKLILGPGRRRSKGPLGTGETKFITTENLVKSSVLGSKAPRRTPQAPNG